MEIWQKGRRGMIVYSKPRLKNLSVGARITFLRQWRGITRLELALKIGLGEENGKRIMSRYERNVILPEDKKLEKMAEVLKVNIRLIRPYDMTDSEDLYYIMLWFEELCPNFTYTMQTTEEAGNETQKYISEHFSEWLTIQKQFRNNEITYDEYWEWKIQ